MRCRVINDDYLLITLQLWQLVDMGSAKIIPDDEKSYTFCGTAEYIAPESLRCSKTGHNKEIDYCREECLFSGDSHIITQFLYFLGHNSH